MARACGVDLRKQGSGNIGATNAMRVLGKPAGFSVLFLDAFKGYAAVHWLPGLNQALEPGHGAVPEWVPLVTGIAAVLGHNYTIWLRFHGGKGIATTAGVYAALAPWPLLLAVGVFVVMVALTRYVSLGSIAAAVALPLAVCLMCPGNPSLKWVTIALGVMAVVKHRSNLGRLLAGTENRLGQKKRETHNS